MKRNGCLLRFFRPASLRGRQTRATARPGPRELSGGAFRGRDAHFVLAAHFPAIFALAWLRDGFGGTRALAPTRETRMATEDRIRVTHCEREAAAEGLRAAYAVGCLDDDELADRVGRAYAAKTRGELTALACDLPVVPAPGDAEPARAPAAADWPGRAGDALALACWLMLAAAGAWLIAAAAGGVLAVPIIFLWLVALQLRGRLPRWGRQVAAAFLISRLSSVTKAPVPGKERA